MKFSYSKLSQYILTIFILAIILLSFIFYTLSKLNTNEDVLTQLEDGLIITKNLLDDRITSYNVCYTKLLRCS